ncbi:MAG: hypothetical protein FK731_12840 [Asgard group archaeon]|nr:hypothetical protein [Asgard group archaeon]
MSKEITTQIPGTTFRIRFGFEGKYYALFLCRGNKEFKSMKLNILRGTSLHELPEEVENGLKDLLFSEQVYLSPVIVKNVANNLLEQMPENGQIIKEEVKQKQFVKSEVSVSDLISKSEDRAGKKSIIEHGPMDKPKYDATADSLGRIELKKPKLLPEKITKHEIIPTEEYKPIKKIEEKIDILDKKPEVTEIVKKEAYNQLDEKVTTLTNEVKSLHEIIDKSNQDIEILKEQIDIIKQDVKISDKTEISEELEEIELEDKEILDIEEIDSGESTTEIIDNEEESYESEEESSDEDL